MRRLLFLFVLANLAAHAARPPAGGRAVEFNQPFIEWRGIGRDAGTAMEVEVVREKNLDFNQSLKVVVKERTEQEYDLQLAGRIKGQIDKEDVLLLSFHAMCEESSDESALGRFTVTGQAQHPRRYLHPFTKTVSVDAEWKHFLIPFVAPIDNRDGYSITFKLGGTKPQVLRIGGLELLNYRNRHTLEQLPVTETYYEGMEPDAPWRKAAQERIEQHRKADLKISVINKYGKPVRGAKVRAELKNHAFGFGVAVGVNSMFGAKSQRDRENYQAAVEELFNKAVFENRMKWKFFRQSDEELEEALDWFAERGIPLRGHCMVWPAWQRLPKGMKAEWIGRTNEFRKVIEERVRQAATVYPEAFAEWDVVNELHTQHEFVDMYGREVVVDWFRIARESNPNFKTYINDYAILAGYDQRHQDSYHEWIGYLLKQEAPLDGIGFQGHFRAPVPPEEILRRIERFAEFGLEMQVTEFDFEETDELLQARFARDFMTVVFSHPQMTGIMTWCLWEDAAWKPLAAFYTSDWKKKRIAQAWEYMTKKEWHTHEVEETGPDGSAKIRGFLGEYEISVFHSGRRQKRLFTLEKKGGAIEIQL